MILDSFLETKSQEDYPLFVAKSGQVNSPPGSYETIKKWITHSFINSSSKVLEIGCSTGFISYQINLYTGAEIIGIDCSQENIDKAKCNCVRLDNVMFFIGNAESLCFEDGTFTHVIIGGHLPWVSVEERARHLKEALRVLKPGGFLLTSVYYFSSSPPKEFLEMFNKEFGTKLHIGGNYNYWSSFFDDPSLQLEYESNFEIKCPSEKRKEQYLSFFEEEYLENWEKKVKLFEENGRYISFFIKIFRKNSNLNYRQVPRGGIYEWKKLNEFIY